MKTEAEFRKLLADFPCFIPEDTAFSCYTGFLQVKDQEFRVRISADCSRFDADQSLQLIIKSSTDLVNNRLQTSQNAHDFLLELRDIIEREIDRKGHTKQNLISALPPVQYYEKLLSDISRIGWNRVEWMDESMRQVELNLEDDQKRKHTIKLEFPPNYPSHPPICITNLPVEFELKWNHHQGIESILEQLDDVIDEYQDYFRVMEDLDQNCLVLEPENATWKDCYRRILVDKNCSLRIEIDPRAAIKGFPQCRFLGSESAISSNRQKLNERIHQWIISSEILPRQNLENILELNFPSVDPNCDNNINNEEHSIECGICYSYRLNENVPDVACDRIECSKPYHRNCLIEWLRALPDTRESFGMITGSCVYCEYAISISVKDIN